MDQFESVIERYYYKQDCITSYIHLLIHVSGSFYCAIYRLQLPEKDTKTKQINRLNGTKLHAND